MNFDPKSVEVKCVTLPKDHCIQVHENTSQYVDTVTIFFFKNLDQGSLTPRWPLTPSLLRSHVWLYPRIIVSKFHENTSKYVHTVTFFPKNLNQRSLTPRWPLNPSLLRSHVWPYPRIIVSKSHENTSQYVDRVTFFQQFEPRVTDPKMTFDPTSVEVTCVTIPKDHCVQVPWEYINVCGYSDQFYETNQNYHILRTYYVQNERSHRLFLNKVQARQKLFVDSQMHLSSACVRRLLFTPVCS